MLPYGMLPYGITRPQWVNGNQTYKIEIITNSSHDKVLISDVLRNAPDVFHLSGSFGLIVDWIKDKKDCFMCTMQFPCCSIYPTDKTT